jgi:hypothetical protein
VEPREASKEKSVVSEDRKKLPLKVRVPVRGRKVPGTARYQVLERGTDWVKGGSKHRGQVSLSR